jgi:hypothetical protein
MSVNNEQRLNNWGAEDDTPVHVDSQVAYLVDAHSTFLTMCRHFLMARKYIYIAGWGMTPPDGTGAWNRLARRTRRQSRTGGARG